MEVIIDGIVYVPKEKSELDLIKEKFESGDYISVCKDISSKWILSRSDTFGMSPKFIHKKHKEILDAYLEDNSVEIEYHIERDLWAIDKNFIDKYEEDCEYRLKQQYSSLIESKDEPSIHLLRHLYHDLGTLKWIGADEGWDLAIEKVREYLSTELNNRLKPEQQYPIFKRSECGVVSKIDNNSKLTVMISNDTSAIGKTFTTKGTWDTFETIPYDKERGLYHLQPVFYKPNDIDCCIDFYDAKYCQLVRRGAILKYYNIEPITPEQLKTMPFVWEMYKKYKG